MITPMLNVAFVRHRASKVSASRRLSWERLAQRLGRHDIGEKDGPGWMPADIQPGDRKAERVKSISALVMDVEAVKSKDGATGPQPPDMEAMQAELGLWHWPCIMHTSYSHTAQQPRYRLIFAVSRPLSCDEIGPLGRHVAGLLGIADCLDGGCLEPARLYYLPRCPAERRHLFHHAVIEGEPLPVDSLLLEARQAEAALSASLARRLGAQSGGAIDAFNRAHDVGTILERHGYIRMGRNRWLHPNSTTGMPGVRLLPKSEPQKVFSSHGGDPLNDGHAHDAFDLSRILEHGGDMARAVKEAVRMLDLDAKRGALVNGSAREKADSAPGEENTVAGDVYGDDQLIARLASMSALDYERIREAEAERLGVRVSVLDKEVAKARPVRQEDIGRALLFDEPEPCPEPVNGARLLDDLVAMFKRFIVLPVHAAEALALWVVFTHAIDAFQVAPILLLTSPEKRCGKTNLLGLLARLCKRSLSTSNVTAAALFRAVEAWEPTLLIDEADTFLANSEELRGVTNSGHSRDTAFVIRTEGEDFHPRRLSTWCAKAIATIGKPAGTILDRSIVIELRRKLTKEKTEKLRHTAREDFRLLASQCARFAEDHLDVMRRTRPVVPDQLNDRAADCWEPLLAIADTAGGDWPQRARDAARNLSGAADTDGDSLRVQLLGDVRSIFRDRGVDRIAGKELTLALIDIEERPWGEISNGRPLTSNKLARLLNPFGIISASKRFGDKTDKGYDIEQFRDAFTRYLPVESVTTLQPDRDGASSHIEKSNNRPALRFEKLSKAAPVLDCNGVTDKTGVAVGSPGVEDF